MIIIILACCGDRCDLCPRYIATLSNDKEKLTEVAILMKKLGWRDKILAPEEMTCNGCASNESCEYNVRECCLEKEIENCGICKDYPCKKIENAFEITRENAEKFRDIVTRKEYQILHEAFFLKKMNLDEVKKMSF